MGGGHWMFGGFMWLFWIAVIIGLVFLIGSLPYCVGKRF